MCNVFSLNAWFGKSSDYLSVNNLSVNLIRLALIATVLCFAIQSKLAGPVDLSSVSLVTNPTNTVLLGKPVSLTATAIGGTNIQYKFMYGTVVLRDFNSNNSFSWTPLALKTYTLTAVAKDLNAVDPNATVISPAVNITTRPALTAVSLTSSPVSTVWLGNTVTLSATSTGGGTVLYKFVNGSDIIRDFDTNSSFVWTPDTANTYNLTVIAKDNQAVNPELTVTSVAKLFQVLQPLTAVSMTTSPVSNLLFGKAVILTAIKTGGVNVHYKFMYGAIVLRNFNASNTFTFTPSALKTYSLTVVAKDLGGVDPASTVTSSIVNITTKPAFTGVVLNTSPVNMAWLGNTVTLTASATGGASLLYKFMSGTDIIRDYGSSNSFVWTPENAQIYNLTVVVKDTQATDPEATITSISKAFVVAQPLSAVSLGTMPVASVLTGKPITLTATKTGGVNVQYKFMYDTVVLRDFSSSNTLVWTPAAIKTYSLTVVAKDLSGVDPNATVTSSVVNITTKAALSGVSLSSDLTTPIVDGKSVNLSATPVGGGTVLYKFMNGADTIRDFDSSNNFVWTPLIAQTYTITVVAKDSQSSNPDMTVTSLVRSFVVVPALSSVVLNATPADTLVLSKQVTLSATKTGGLSVQYKFLNGISVIRDYNSSNSFVWTPDSTGLCYLTVVAKDSQAADPDAIITSSVVLLNVVNGLTGVSLNSSPIDTVLYGNPVTLTASNTGGANLQYKFMLGTVILRDFSSSNTFTWTPAALNRTYSLTAVAKDLGGIDPNAIVTSSVVNITTKPAVTIVTLSVSPLNMIWLSNTVTLTASSVGGGSVLYKFMNGTDIIRDYDSTNSFVWTPQSAQICSLTVVLKDLQQNDPNATIVSLPKAFAVVEPLSAVSLNTLPVNTCPLGNPVTLTAIKTGGLNVQYKFMMGTTVLRDFNVSNSYTFTPGNVKTYNLTVVAKDLGGVNPATTFTSTTVNYVVTSALSPTITSFTPAGGKVGTIITITGTNFIPASTVKINGLAVTSFTIISPTTISAVIPVGTTTGKVTVTNIGGTATSSNDLTIYKTPELTMISPISGRPGTAVTLTGINFTGAIEVKFGEGIATNFNIVDDTSITTFVPGDATPGLVTVTTPGGVSSSIFFIVYRVPVIASFDPVTGNAGQAITITGNYFFDVSDVKINDISLTDVVVIGETSITATIPEGAYTGKLSVTTPGGTGYTDGNFVMPLTIDSFSPLNGKYGTVVTLTGNNFWGTTAVKFNGVSAITFNIVDGNTITAVVPANATTGLISITSPYGTVSTTEEFFVYQQPVITSFTPTSGPIGQVVNITGTDFYDVSSVKFNDVTVENYIYNSSTSITATVPFTANTGKISITTPGGIAYSGNDYIIANLIDNAPLVYVPSGTFTMGTPDNIVYYGNERMAHQVTLSGFWSYKYEVTVAQYRQFCTATSRPLPKFPQPIIDWGYGYPSNLSWANKSGWDDPSLQQHPIVNVIWDDAKAYATWAGVALPTEAQWEYTARGPLSPIYPWGGFSANYNDRQNGWDTNKSANVYNSLNAYISTWPVGSFPTGASWCGALDMSGNVSEWTLNWTTNTNQGYSASPVTDPVDSSPSTYAIVRGGNWYVNSDAGRSAYRSVSTWGRASEMIGFRCVTIPPAITSFAPTGGPVGETVTITGTKFTGAFVVKINGLLAQFTVNSATSITVTIPNGATTGKINISTPGGMTDSLTDLIVYQPPTLSSFTPVIGAEGAVVTVTGTNFTGATFVNFNGTSAVFNVDSSSSITVTVPVGVTTGKIQIITPGGSVTSTDDFEVVLGYKLNTDNAEMVWVPGATFTMGSIDGAEWTAPYTQQVTLSGYWIYRNDVTVAQYLAFCAATERLLPFWPGDNYSWAGKSGWTDPSLQQHPIVNVSWDDCKAYADWAGVTLPTEAQWEYAARGPQGNNYPWGGTAGASDPTNGWDENKCANYINSDAVNISTWPVGSFATGKSWCGAKDMAGNTWQWCADWYGDYSLNPVTNPTGPESGTDKVLRGGCWYNFYSNALRSSYRYKIAPGTGYTGIGFRCVSMTPGL